MTRKKAIITGVTGQDGSYLTELLLEKGYEVYGIIRRSSSFNTERIDHLHDYEKEKDFFTVYGDLTDLSSISKVVSEVKPDEFYNLGAQSHVRISFDTPIYTCDVDALGTLRCLEAIRTLSPKTRFYQASSSEMFGGITNKPLNEDSLFNPRSPYACAKVFSYWVTKNYREAYGLFAVNGILFNHESPRRGENFVTRKIAKGVARIKLGLQSELYLGNLDAKRDWGYAKDYCINKDVPILTPRGWKYHDELNDNDSIINFDFKTDSLSEDKINKKVYTECDGEKIVIEGRGVYLKCTKNHRIIYQSKSKQSKGGWSKWKETTAHELYNHFSNIKNRTKYDYRFPHFSKYVKNDYQNISDDKISLMGYLLAEGCFSRGNMATSTVISISQSRLVNENKHVNIKNTLNRLGLAYNERNRNDGITEWVFNSSSSKEILKLFDTLDIHVAPSYIYNFSQRQANILFNALMDCDGHWASLTYTSKRYLLATDFQTIAHLAGYRTSSISKNGNCYVVNVVVKSKKYTYIQSIKLLKDNITDVWCVNTNNGTIITRDNNSIFISGNCEAMWLMLQQDKPDDFVIATGETHSVREFLEEAFSYQGLDYKKFVKLDKRFLRPTEVNSLLGNSSKARNILGWAPKVHFKELVKLMVDSELNRGACK